MVPSTHPLPPLGAWVPVPAVVGGVAFPEGGGATVVALTHDQQAGVVRVEARGGGVAAPWAGEPVPLVVGG